MSLLDGMFDSGPDLTVSPVQITADAVVEPGFMYLVYSSDAPREVTIAAHAPADVAGQRVALKAIFGDESAPGELRVIAPSGQRIENDIGSLEASTAVPDGQVPGAYTEWLCDAAGNWWRVRSGGGGGGGGAIVVQEEGFDVGDSPRAKLNFKGDIVYAVDNPETDSVDVTIALGEGSLPVILPPRVRMPFTLRKVSTNALIAEEIGVLRFDAWLYAGWPVKLIAEMDVSVPGQSAVLELVSLDDSTIVETLTTGALTTTKCEAVVPIVSHDTLYAVRLARVGGTENDFVSCRAVELEVGYNA